MLTGTLDLVQVDLLALAGRDTNLKWKASTNGGEHAGPCPFCGGRDRFVVQPHAPNRGVWYCRGCGGERWHDAIDYMMRRDGLRFKEACTALTIQLPDRRLPLPPAPPMPVEPPSAGWQEAATDFLSTCFDTLWSDEGDCARAWLHSRGFTEETIARACLGFHTGTQSNGDLWLPRERWDLPSLCKRNGRPARLWLPRGIVIPSFVRGHLWALTIRRPVQGKKDSGKHDQKYVVVAGSTNDLYNVDALKADYPAALVEGAFDALAVRQAAEDLVVPVATLSTTGARRVSWICRLAIAPKVLIAYDADHAGEKASAYWLDVLRGQARRWRPYWQDPAAMLEAGMDVRGWIEVGLNQEP